ncbi:DUF1254 domain-containing protein [Nocardia sp. NPDC051929]|uniref:DUF1254 domain-containing protein n=1 Tax=Nocardia sp. NPDC051929 TaxID=3364327 RepID=UPI0037CCA1F8
MDERTEGKLTMSRRTALGIAMSSVAALGSAACGGFGQDSGPHPVPGDAATIAKDAYVFGYPLVLLDVTRVAAEMVTPINRFHHAASLPTPAQRDVVRLDRDTLRSTAWLDVASEPMVLSVPALDEGRFWLAKVTDAWTNNVHNPSSRRPATESAGPPYTYAVTGPGWSGALPEGLTPLPMPTPTVWLIVRIRVDGESDLPAVRAAQEGLRLVPLSAWVAGTEPPAPTGTGQSSVQPPPEWVAGMDPRVFFDRMCALLSTNPTAPEDAPAMRRFEKIGIRPGGTVEGISDTELTAAVETARQQIPVSLGARTVNENGWLVDPDVGRFGTNYLLRAVIAHVALGASLMTENAYYPTLFASTDAGGGTGRFRLHFAPGQLPPVDEFWSLTAYAADNYLVPNPAGIYAVGHPDPVTVNPDGSVDIALQYTDPRAGVAAGNWLPIPESGQFSLTLRLYAPKAEAVQGRWRPPPLLPAL